MRPRQEFTIDGRNIGEDWPTYFIADIAANHDGDLERAKHLIRLAGDVGADAAKFQHFSAETIVSDFGFKSLGEQKSHQANWQKSVFEVYKSATVDLGWTEELKAACDEVGIAFFTSPYSFELVDAIDPFVPAFKIGSGDITWLQIIRHIASKQKPLIIASGASSMDEVERAVQTACEINQSVALMQCNTNYTGDLENMRYIQLNVLKSYRAMYPDIVLGLSDHTPGHATVLGAVALGARMVEKHFTDDDKRLGPDHAFSMTPDAWRDMIKLTRQLEFALGDGRKKVEKNEEQTRVLQRRCIRLVRDLKLGARIAVEDLSVLRPCPEDGLPPYLVNDLVGRILRRDKPAGSHITINDID